MQWLKELTSLLGERSLFFMPGILTVVLPCLSYGDDYLKKSIKELARNINTSLWNLIDKKHSETRGSPSKSPKLAIDKLIEGLSRLMTTPTEPMTVLTTIESLKWVLHLVNKQPDLVSIK
jgi:hypothetical protein